MNTLLAAADPSQNLFQQAIDAAIPIGPYELHWLELIGVLIGVASAWYGMKRAVWAWPVGIVANVMLFFVYIGAAFGADQRIPLFGQSGRQVLFIAVSLYGWVRWAQHRRAAGGVGGAPVLVPRWMTSRERLVVAAGWLLGTAVVWYLFLQLWNLAPDPYWTPQWWYYAADAWIFVGSFVATYAMARGWNEFWLAWIGVDLIGVPLGFATGYVPTSVMYIFYGLFVLYGFTQWVKVTRAARQEARDVDPAPVA
ncbi:nicotinamide mononucleotide transporter [Phycicoccus endophyticus]|uniref:Nicotinamide mononucleotide transporter n=1 Tax=Phycicoccus endophyticus TaxID=1690220 RepID=A0A7G9R4A3_9MICO|nr:nicotinamide mononucleotide transporter family protein [Phycicoccus endophyticus]NHI18289.1 nicotinamide mononucleotide transporter [Phycicoccus endophyticus]QNN50428.1 nicotinamide mononucleotide transporter [Phycicoccus endophyticus]GGL24949.1 nicotinamide mononucleotide transporter [Phycicoccus endophyticus]